ncbi:ATP-dependent DNA helicase RecG [Vannielia sp.]|uniref:ATP-dependent DNA helicase RecG n=1 Tax=Vannielia sp. TaxID=2813045 RepID=UPI00261FAABC|nr:ATP-dependent DNA helicase RecG [Vannielia sp.]MDF1872583.1 ATP-dependent DNA helicase RecG [Vannielia sp.]
MSTRPQRLFPLFAEVDTLPGVGPKSKKALAGMGISRVRDMLYTLPHGVVDRRRRDTVQGVAPGTMVTVEVTVKRHRGSSRPGGPYRVEVEDAQIDFTLMFFRGGGKWLEQQLPTGQRRVISGKLEHFDGMAQIVHPDYILRPDEAGEIPEFEPIYPLTAGVTQRVMGKAAEAALARAPALDEWMDGTLVAQEGWPAWKDAMEAAHRPKGAAEVSETAPARRRLAYDELFAHQLTLALARAGRQAKPGIASVGDGRLQRAVLDELPYTPTGAQTRAVSEIAGDMAAPRRMNRLLQGDVGAGKTLVALMALLIAVEAGGQGVLMAPTEILARQHFGALAPLAEAAGLRVELLTGRDKGADRAAKLAAIAEGDVHILVGTHAVFQDEVQFGDLRLTVIDEQHRFGVNERARLGAKGAAVDVLVMSATPIPRSLSLTQYGDMEISVLDEKPPGRTPVTTAMVSAERMDAVVERLRAAVAEGRQCYWVCPLVEESEITAATAAEERFKRLRAALGEGRVGLVHGQLRPDEKDAAMARFVAGETGVLVATTVIEVGVDVPNASIMVIEQAERFGLAQLHQLRGRVGRGAVESTCILMYQPPLGETARTRLTTLRETEDGFRIAEVDLEMRGAGDVLGTAQSGLPKFRIADVERMGALAELAQSDARTLLELDPALEGKRGTAARGLLWLTEQDRAIRLLSVG